MPIGRHPRIATSLDLLEASRHARYLLGNVFTGETREEKGLGDESEPFGLVEAASTFTKTSAANVTPIKAAG